MVRKGAHGRQRRALLAAALGGGRDEEAGVLAVVGARLPLLARVVPKGLPLVGQVAEAGRDPEEEGVILFELLRGDEGDRCRLGGCVHFGQDLLGEGLFDSVWMKEAGQFFLLCATGKVIKVPSCPNLVLLRSGNGNLLEHVGFASGALNAGFLCLGKLGNVAIHGILYRLSQYAVWMQLRWPPYSCKSRDGQWC